MERLREAATSHARGDLPRAESLYREIVARHPENFPATYYLALVRAQLGATEEAVTWFRAAVKLNGSVAELRNNLGMALSKLGQFAPAIAEYEKALELSPGYFVAQRNHGAALGLAGRHAEALAAYQNALDLEPGHAETLNDIGTEHFALGQATEAIAHFRRAISASEGYAVAYLNLGNALAHCGEPRKALEAYESALRSNPTSGEILMRMGDVHERLRDYGEALRLYQRVGEDQPNWAECQLRLGYALQMLCRHESALAAYQRFLAVQPDHAEAWDCVGFASAELGRSEEARRAFQAALRHEPGRSKSYFGLVNSARVKPGDPVIRELENLKADVSRRSEQEQIHLHFALGKMLSDIGEYERSFAHLRKGNYLRRKEISYDEDRTLRRFKTIARVLNRERVGELENLGSPSARPIFILGMMRSGTTLVEQILASHPLVTAGGERIDFQAAVNDELGASGSDWVFDAPDVDKRLTGELLQRIARNYLGRLEQGVDGLDRARPDEGRRITDKLPANYFLVGLIHLVFPNAAIIHTSRDPIDTCLSCYENLFGETQAHTYDLAEMGRYYRSYSELMDQWRGILPAGRMLEVRYEQLVANFDPEARRILAYCGLEWHEHCARFYETPRAVRTASHAQVRQPIYKTSVGKPRPAESELLPLLVELGLRER